jgi:hypothetical protein
MAFREPMSSRFESGGDRRNVVEFRERGSDRRYEGHNVRVTACNVQFDTDYGVAPGSSLNLRLHVGNQDEVRMEVMRVDSRPGDRFRIAGRICRDH